MSAYRDPEVIAVIKVECHHCWHEIVHLRMDMICCFCSTVIRNKELYEQIHKDHGPYKPKRIMG